jgi:methionine-rich copper-binding protein CopC
MGKEGLSTGKGRLEGGTLKVLLLCVALAAPSWVWAHASLVKSVPAQRAVLDRPPAKIQLWFSERLEARFSSFSVFDATGKPVDLGTVELDRDDPKSLVAEIKALPPGRYVIRFRVLSTDGHVTQNEFAFTLSR